MESAYGIIKQVHFNKENSLTIFVVVIFVNIKSGPEFTGAGSCPEPEM